MHDPRAERISFNYVYAMRGDGHGKWFVDEMQPDGGKYTIGPIDTMELAFEIIDERKRLFIATIEAQKRGAMGGPKSA